MRNDYWKVAAMTVLGILFGISTTGLSSLLDKNPGPIAAFLQTFSVPAALISAVAGHRSGGNHIEVNFINFLMINVLIWAAAFFAVGWFHRKNSWRGIAAAQVVVLGICWFAIKGLLFIAPFLFPAT